MLSLTFLSIVGILLTKCKAPLFGGEQYFDFLAIY